MFLLKLKRVAETIGLACFALLAVYGTICLVRGDLVQAIGRTGSVAAAEARQATQQGELTAPQAAAMADWPITFNYQGTLRLTDGSPANGTYTMTLSIYDSVVTGTGALLHQETASNVVVRDGLFSVLLGDQAGKPISAQVFATMPRYLGIAVHPDPEMQPRQRIPPAPWAIHATTAATATRAYGLSAADGDPIDAVTVDNSGNVGVGTLNPEWITLDVNGRAKVRGELHLGMFRTSIDPEGFDGGGCHWIRSGENDSKMWFCFFQDAQGVPSEIHANVPFFGPGFYPVSDVNLKTNVTQLANVLEKLKQIRGVSYESKNDPVGHRGIGVIAQEVETVFPELVSTMGGQGYKAVNYDGLIGPLIEAIKELQAENEALRQRIEALEKANKP